MDAHEAHERIEEAHHRNNKKVALLIAILAALLSITEIGAQGAQNHYTASNIEVVDLWMFYQAKTIRMTTVRTAADAVAALTPEGLPPDRAQVLESQIAKWRSDVNRYDSDPATNEGGKELLAQAKAVEEHRNQMLAVYHNFEYGAGAFQLGIVLASASVITGMVWLAIAAGGMGVLGIALGLLGWLAPTLIHF